MATPVAPTQAASTLDAAAQRLADLLLGRAPGGIRDATATDLEFEAAPTLRRLERLPAPADAWAVDGGQALVADARCLQVVVTRAARTRFRRGVCVLEEEGDLRAHLLGGSEERVAALLTLALQELRPDTSVDVNLLRDRWEWQAIERCIEEAEPGAVVLVDGDLQPDWRIPSSYLRDLLAAAADRQVLLAAVTKHSSLSRNGAPLLGQLEAEAEVEASLGPRAMWWAPVARTRATERPDTPGIQVVAARLDPDARFSFRIDLPAGVDPASALGPISALCDDAAFPGYPYPLTVADRLAACPGWLRAEAWMQLDDLLAANGVPADVRERAFADRHRLMERA